MKPFYDYFDADVEFEESEVLHIVASDIEITEEAPRVDCGDSYQFSLPAFTYNCGFDQAGKVLTKMYGALKPKATG